jgi:two-component system chemotaxis sensor kinase CheA
MEEDLDILKELTDEFIKEAPQFLDQLEAHLEALAADAANREGVEAVAEILKTLIQRVGFLNFDVMVALLQGLLGLLATPEPPGPDTIDLLRQGLDQIGEGLQFLGAYEPASFEPTALLAELNAGVGFAAPATTAAEEAPAKAQPEEQVEAELTPESQVAALQAPEAAPEPLPAPSAEEEDEVVQEGPLTGEVLDFVPDFITESNEILEKLDENLVRLEEASGDLDLLNEIFRGAHTLKGAAGFLGFTQMGGVTHKMENVLDLLRKGQIQLSQGIMDVILQGVDQIKVLQADIRNNIIVRRDTSAVRRSLARIVETKGAEAGVPAPAAAAGVPAAPPSPRPAAAPATPAPHEAAPGGGAHPPVADQVIRVDVERIDKIMTLAEELVLGRNRLLQLNTQLVAAHGEEELVNRLNEATAQVNMLTGELQESVMMMRMIPVSRVFARFPRMVRDLARDLNKQIELVVEDHDAEIDKSVADEIGDPLIHLIRNAVDHGVETPELRQQAGKDPRGTIRLSATHEANHIVLRIQDDGKGMDPVKLKQKAVERGILSAADAERMEDTEAYNLIFLPGFSMAQAITSVSGRGVGMDVVRTNITRLNGTIDLESVLGQGTTITIRLPLTLAIISGLQVGAAGEIFIVPLTAVIEALRISQDQVENLQGRQVILARDKVLPLINLAQVLQVPAAKSEKNEAYVVVTGLAERRMGILVDRLLGQVDVVIKALGDFVGPAQGIAGATILGDGRVRLILDVGKLMDLQERYREVG